MPFWPLRGVRPLRFIIGDTSQFGVIYM